MLFTVNALCAKLTQFKKDLVSTVDTDGLEAGIIMFCHDLGKQGTKASTEQDMVLTIFSLNFFA